jgi:RNA-directed DNA polymerase
VAAFVGKARRIIKANTPATAGHLIVQLNPVIRGWANYHQHVTSKQIFGKVDHAIFQALWQWAKRRHPQKSKRWIKNKYFHTVGGRQWVFQGEITGKDGRPQTVRLFHAASLPIKRHTKIKGRANPYDLEWEVYLEERLGVKMADDLQGRRTLLYLWQEQRGICPVCGEKITKLTGWHNHHIVWRTKGGGNDIENRMLLHPNCHSQVHSRGLAVAKPRPAKGV